jgi:hypothetical protein
LTFFVKDSDSILISKILGRKVINRAILTTYFPFFRLINTSPMKRMNKATLLGDLLFSYAKRKKSSKTACVLVLAFYSWNMPLFVK